MSKFTFLPIEDNALIRKLSVSKRVDSEENTFAELSWEWSDGGAVNAVLLFELPAEVVDNRMDIENIAEKTPYVFVRRNDTRSKELQVHHFHSKFLTLPAIIDGGKISIYKQNEGNTVDVFCRAEMRYEVRPHNVAQERKIEEVYELFNPKDKTMKFISRVVMIGFVVWLLLLLLKACSLVSVPPINAPSNSPQASSPAQTITPTQSPNPSFSPSPLPTIAATATPDSVFPDYQSDSIPVTNDSGNNVFKSFIDWVSGIRFAGGFFSFMFSTTGIILLIIIVLILLAILYYFGRAQKSNHKRVALYLDGDSIIDGVAMRYIISGYGNAAFPVRYSETNKLKPAAVFFAPKDSVVSLAYSSADESPIAFRVMIDKTNKV